MRYLNRMLKLKYVLDISDSASRARQRMAFAGLSFLMVFFFALVVPSLATARAWHS